MLILLLLTHIQINTLFKYSLVLSGLRKYMVAITVLNGRMVFLVVVYMAIHKKIYLLMSLTYVVIRKYICAIMLKS